MPKPGPVGNHAIQMTGTIVTATLYLREFNDERISWVQMNFLLRLRIQLVVELFIESLWGKGCNFVDAEHRQINYLIIGQGGHRDNQ
ncbi:hypothetical protein KBI23_06435 [bacterium]|nr:hypothetical protein [bacterium]MBP9807096.1 hypothetical protein [bacterium]